MKLREICVRTFVPLMLVVAFFATALGGAVGNPHVDLINATSHAHAQNSAGIPCVPMQDSQAHGHVCLVGGTCLAGVLPSVVFVPVMTVRSARGRFVQSPEFRSQSFPEYRPPESAA
jgi:hypothetical protein